MVSLLSEWMTWFFTVATKFPVIYQKDDYELSEAEDKVSYYGLRRMTWFHYCQNG